MPIWPRITSYNVCYTKLLREWARKEDYTDEEIKEAILASFSDLDRPLSPSGKASREFNNQYQHLSLEMRQTFRKKLLEVTQKSLRDVAERYLKQGWSASAVAVLSGEELLQHANADLKDAPLTLEKI